MINLSLMLHITIQQNIARTSYTHKTNVRSYSTAYHSIVHDNIPTHVIQHVTVCQYVIMQHCARHHDIVRSDTVDMYVCMYLCKDVHTQTTV